MTINYHIWYVRNEYKLYLKEVYVDVKHSQTTLRRLERKANA